jgi:hypothetical protein
MEEQLAQMIKSEKAKGLQSLREKEQEEKKEKRGRGENSTD